MSDRTTELQALIDSAASSGVPLVLSGVWEVDEISLPDGAHIVGPATIRRMSGLGPGRMLETGLEGGTYVLQDLTLDANTEDHGSTSFQYHALTVLGPSDVIVSNCTVTGAWGDGIYIGSNSFGIPARCLIESVLVYDCKRSGIAYLGHGGTFCCVRALRCGLAGVKTEHHDSTQRQGALFAKIYTRDCAQGGVTIGGHGAGGGHLLDAHAIHLDCPDGIVVGGCKRASVMASNGPVTVTAHADGVRLDRVVGDVSVGGYAAAPPTDVVMTRCRGDTFLVRQGYTTEWTPPTGVRVVNCSYDTLDVHTNATVEYA